MAQLCRPGPSYCTTTYSRWVRHDGRRTTRPVDRSSAAARSRSSRGLASGVKASVHPHDDAPRQNRRLRRPFSLRVTSTTVTAMHYCTRRQNRSSVCICNCSCSILYISPAAVFWTSLIQQQIFKVYDFWVSFGGNYCVRPCSLHVCVSVSVIKTLEVWW
jgi:hypothetical protein